MAAVNLPFSQCPVLLQLLSATGLNDGVGEISGLLLNTVCDDDSGTFLRDIVSLVARLRSIAPCQLFPCTIACSINDHQLVADVASHSVFSTVGRSASSTNHSVPLIYHFLHKMFYCVVHLKLI